VKTVEVFFKKTFTLRDDQPDNEPVKNWTRDMGLTYVYHRRIDNENAADISLDDLVRYISGGEASPSIAAWISSAASKPTIASLAEPDDQSDGAGAHWR
jgi:hypothetical protein